jgi:hypothetical protein
MKKRCHQAIIQRLAKYFRPFLLSVLGHEKSRESLRYQNEKAIRAIGDLLKTV